MPKHLFDPASTEPFKLSRSGLELFHDCPRCFYLDKRLGIGRPGGFPFSLNSAVDSLLKREFDFHRARGEPHPLMTAAGIDAVPFVHPDLSKWRHNFTGVRHLHAATGLLVYGAVDDLWQTPGGELIVVDYKATAKKDEITSLDQEWHGGYKRQLEIYQWLLRRNGFRVADRAWWVYANGDASAERFDHTIRFRMTLIPYDGDDSWVEEHVRRAHACLSAPKAPRAAEDCDWCRYATEASSLTGASKAEPIAARPIPISSGTLLYRFRETGLEVLLVRASSRDGRSIPWGIPKGGPRDGESLEDAARRETLEETGVVAPGTLEDLGSVTSRGYPKTVHCFAGQVGDECQPTCASTEIDRAEFLAIDQARRVIRGYQADLLDRLVNRLRGREGPRRGVTFLESLVAAAVAVVFVAVALPAIDLAREGSRRNGCAANQAAVAGAMLARHDSHGRFPDGIGFSDAGCLPYTGRTLWTFTLLPLLGHDDVAALIVPRTWGAGPVNGDSMRGFRATIPHYRCPSDTHALVTDPLHGTVDHTRANVVACFSPHGFAVEPEADPECLVHQHMHGGERTLDNPTVLSVEPLATRPGRALFNVRGVPRSLESVTDGASVSLMLSETVSGESPEDFRGMWWADQGVQFSCYRTPNHPGEDFHGGNGAVPVRSAKDGLPGIAVRPGGWPALLEAARSRHGGIVNAAFVDGSVRPVRDDVAARVWTSLGSIDGADDDAP